MKQRVFITLLLLAMILFSPYWAYISALVVVSVFFPVYFEAILLGFFIDTLYHAGELGSLGLVPHALLFSIFIIALIPLKERLRFNV